MGFGFGSSGNFLDVGQLKGGFCFHGESLKQQSPQV
jgi:hypothetical protein